MYIQYKMCVSLPQPSNQFTPGRGGYGAAAPCSAYYGLSFCENPIPYHTAILSRYFLWRYFLWRNLSRYFYGETHRDIFMAILIAIFLWRNSSWYFYGETIVNKGNKSRYIWKQFICQCQCVTINQYFYSQFSTDWARFRAAADSTKRSNLANDTLK